MVEVAARETLCWLCISRRGLLATLCPRNQLTPAPTLAPPLQSAPLPTQFRRSLHGVVGDYDPHSGAVAPWLVAVLPTHTRGARCAL